MVRLRGITWDHARGAAPMMATAAAWAGMPEGEGVEIAWTTRSLQAFGDQPIEQLSAEYDLLVIDHPFVGVAARSGCLAPLDSYLPDDFLAAQACQSVGPSYESYTYGGHQWALAIDAAAQVSAYRPDLLRRVGIGVPRTWDAALDLAEQTARDGGPRVALPLSPVNTICSFLTLCANHGEPAGRASVTLVARQAAQTALDILRRLMTVAHPASLDLNPPDMLTRMATTDEIVYCPLTFGYSNYARPNYAPHLLRFANIPGPTPAGKPHGALLGGAGLAISSRCRGEALVAALAYAQWVADAACQRTLYVQSGGQPGNRVAWEDAAANAATGNFFLDTLETLDHSYLRPRYNGFAAFQDLAGPALNAYLRTGGDEQIILDHLDALYRDSRQSL